MAGGTIGTRRGPGRANQGNAAGPGRVYELPVPGLVAAEASFGRGSPRPTRPSRNWPMTPRAHDYGGVRTARLKLRVFTMTSRSMIRASPAALGNRQARRWAAQLTKMGQEGRGSDFRGNLCELSEELLASLHFFCHLSPPHTQIASQGVTCRDTLNIQCVEDGAV